MKTRLLIAASAALALFAAAPAQAHRQWMLPSSTVLSGDDVWVTVDAAVSNDLFYFEHQPLRLDAVKAWAPDGSEASIENKATGRYRSTFDVHLTQKGTWRIASVADMLMGSYDLDGKTERLPRGTTAANLAERLPAGATNVQALAPTPIDYAIDAQLVLYKNTDVASVLAQAQAAAEAYKADRAAGLGRDIVPVQVEAAIKVAGVYDIVRTAPAKIVLAENEWARCTGINLVVTGTVDG